VGFKQRLGELEARTEAEACRGETPPEMNVLLKAIARDQARKEGKEPPSYTQEEIEEMRRSDLEVAEGGGVVGVFRQSRGWQSEEARELLDSWERDAHRRLEQAQDLSPERWREVWGVDD
jgi:hypothetical protein